MIFYTYYRLIYIHIGRSSCDRTYWHISPNETVFIFFFLCVFSLNPHKCVDTFTEDQSSSNKRISLQPSTSSTSTCRRPFSTTEEEPQPISSQGVSSASAPAGEPAGGPTVHYYWGVPFCPRGLDPDTYTQVNVCFITWYVMNTDLFIKSVSRNNNLRIN